MTEVFLNVEPLSAGEMELRHEEIPLRAMVETCTNRARPLADRKRISLTLDEVGDELRVAGDRELMEYACYNLLTNALMYSPQHTEVRISSWRDNIRLAVKDQGIGMDPKEVTRIFQKFYRTTMRGAFTGADRDRSGVFEAANRAPCSSTKSAMSV
jgi:signal transduction histidine kinase